VSRGNGLKARRQHAILALVSRERLGSQQEIGERLGDLGIDATQSTISRDILEIGLARMHDTDGVCYVVPGDAPTVAQPVTMLKRLLDEFALSFVRADHGLLVRTPPGAASALAEGIDRADLPPIAGTIAGDNTILVLGRQGQTPSRLELALKKIMEETT
jgi:transcriptional regulator of arginine metabolism